MSYTLEECYNLDVRLPEDVAPVLRYAASQYRESAKEITDAFKGHPNIGNLWLKIAAILDEAAENIDTRCTVVEPRDGRKGK